MILGGGPNRIGQGIEFDYCCVHAAFALRELGFETIMVNSNPETVSTDYDTSDKLYFEPLTLEDVLNIYNQEQPEGVFVQFGGQTQLNLASGLEAAGVPILGTQTASIETAENGKIFSANRDKPPLRQTPKRIAPNPEDAPAAARALNVRGLMNVLFGVKGEEVYVLEVNARASRPVQFVSKAIGVPLAKLAAKVMTGISLRELGFTKEIVPNHFSVKEAVFPFLRYEGLDISLGPEMTSTGEVMGIDIDLGLAYAKSQMAAPPPLPKGGRVFVSVKDADKEAIIPIAREFLKLGFEIVSTGGTAEALIEAKIKVTKVFKIHE